MRPAGSRWAWGFLIDIGLFLCVFAAIFGLYAIGRTWLGPVHPEAQISQNPRDLPLYALYSLVRIGVAYALSLVFALAYGYIAASSRPRNNNSRDVNPPRRLIQFRTGAGYASSTSSEASGSG